MALTGLLEEFRLPHIIGLLEVEKQTGELALEQDGQLARIYFQGGAIVHAIAEGVSGYDAALVPFGWNQGAFRFAGRELEVEPTITAPNAGIVEAGRRRAAEVAEARALIADMTSVVRLVPRVESSAGQVTLSFEDWRFLTLVDGRRGLRALAAHLGLDDFGIRVIAGRMVKNGLIELVNPRLGMLRLVAQPVSMAASPPDDPTTALMDEQALDMLLKHERRSAQAELLTADDCSTVVQIEGRPNLANKLLLSEALMSRLSLQPNGLVHLRLIE